MSADWSSVRAEFPALVRWTYLNTATYGQVPRRSSEAVARHFRRRDETASADFLSWFDDADRLRADLARLIRCSADDIAFMPNASLALATVMNGLDWQEGDRVITLEGEFPNNLYSAAVQVPWERLYDEVQFGGGLVVLSSANYATGFRPPLAEVSRFVHERGGLLYVDATQTLGALSFDCAEVQPDFVGVDGYKWLLCPNGAGFLYVRPELRPRVRPTVVGWRSDKRWRSVNALHHGPPEFVDAAERYEGGMLDFPALYGMAESVGMILELGPEQIEARVLELAGACAGILEEAGGRVLHRDTPIVAARFNGMDAADLAARLRERGILVSARHGALRVSTHFYNNEEDLQRLREALHASR